MSRLGGSISEAKKEVRIFAERHFSKQVDLWENLVSVLKSSTLLLFSLLNSFHLRSTELQLLVWKFLSCRGLTFLFENIVECSDCSSLLNMSKTE